MCFFNHELSELYTLWFVFLVPLCFMDIIVHTLPATATCLDVLLCCSCILGSWLGLGTDENGIIKVLGHRNASQRKKIRETYQQLYNKSLIDDLHSELSGDFGVICQLHQSL